MAEKRFGIITKPQTAKTAQGRYHGAPVVSPVFWGKFLFFKHL
jgi:hypothetical protein